MDGIVVVNKHKGVTSRAIVNDLMHIFNTKKIGHTGTLDPIAEGVLVVCIGNCTKLVELLTSTTKEYIATIKLGIKTDTGDITGNVIEEKSFDVSKERVVEVLNSFLGNSIQEVPIYSAVKVRGKKLYEYARNNIEVELPKREINITNIELLNYEKDEIKFKVEVSKGTYIRSLINDICTKLNTVGTMSSLIRTKQSIFTIDESSTLDDIKNNNYKLLNKEDILDLEKLEIDENTYNKIKNGAIIEKKFSSNLCSLIYQDKIVAIYETYHKDNNLAKPYKMF